MSTGQGLMGNNMFVYCGNNPIINSDATGTMHIREAGFGGGGGGGGGGLIVDTSGWGYVGVTVVTTVVTSTVENTSYQGPVRDQSVYVMRDKISKKVKYVGRTNCPERRQREHDRDLRKSNLLPLEVKFSGLTKSEARVMEQVLISAYSLDYLSNARREIAVGKVGGFTGEIGNIVKIFGGVAEDELLNLMGR